MLVRATQEGYYQRKRKPGDVFEYPGRIDGCSWLVPAESPPVEVKVPPPEEPVDTLHDYQTRGPGKPFKRGARGC